MIYYVTIHTNDPQ